MATYTSIEGKTGRIYEYSKTEKEGFDKHENSKGKVTYRKYYNKGLYGIYKGTSIRKTDFGDQLSVSMEDAVGNLIYLGIPLHTQKGSIGSYAEDFISYVPDMEEGHKYRIYPYVTENEGKDGKTYTNPGVSIKYSVDDLSEEKVNEDYSLARLSKSYYKGGEGNRELVEGDIPPKEYKKVAGNTKVDTDKRDEYMYNVLVSSDHVTDNRNNTQTSSEKPAENSKPQKTVSTSKPPKSTSEKPPVKDAKPKADSDDLPF